MLKHPFQRGGVIAFDHRVDVERKRDRSIAEFLDPIIRNKAPGHPNLEHAFAERPDIGDSRSTSKRNAEKRRNWKRRNAPPSRPLLSSTALRADFRRNCWRSLARRGRFACLSPPRHQILNCRTAKRLKDYQGSIGAFLKWLVRSDRCEQNPPRGKGTRECASGGLSSRAAMSARLRLLWLIEVSLIRRTSPARPGQGDSFFEKHLAAQVSFDTPKAMDSRRRAEWQIAAWFVFLLAFVFVGSVPIGGIRRLLQVHNQGPTNSTDATLAADLGFADGSRRIGNCLEKVPRGGAVGIVFELGSYHTVSAQIISLAAWSRGLRTVQIPSRGGRVRANLEQARTDAAFFLGPESPAWLPGAERLGNELYFIRESVFHR